MQRGDFTVIDATNSKTSPLESHRYQTNIFAAPYNINISVEETIAALRQNHYIQEKKFGEISSFNFTDKAFFDRVWDEQTTRARGLYLDTFDNSYPALYQKTPLPFSQNHCNCQRPLSSALWQRMTNSLESC